MGERSGYEPGTFCWVDLATTDADGAKAFYSGLFGWDLEDIPADDAGVYTMASLQQKHVAAIYPQPAEQSEGDAPPSWMSFVLVEDVEASARRAGELGATVLAPPFDVAESGRQAVIADRQGAVFSLWQKKEHFGAGLVNEPGALCLNQLNTSDPEAALRFYGDLFGWRNEYAGGEGEDERYWGFFLGEAMGAGMMPLSQAGPGPAHWFDYFATAGLAASIEKVSELGGSIVAGPMPGGPGQIAVALDPQGALFGLYEGPLDP